MGKMADSNKNDEFQWVLDELPYGISVQKPNREILYENRTIKDQIIDKIKKGHEHND